MKEPPAAIVNSALRAGRVQTAEGAAQRAKRLDAPEHGVTICSRRRNV